MPKYCYVCDKCGELTERVFSVDERKPWVKCCKCKAKAERDFAAEHGGFIDQPGLWNDGNGVESLSSAVHPKQAKQLESFLRSRGCPTKVTPEGKPIITSHEHQRRYAKVRGLDRLDSYF